MGSITIVVGNFASRELDQEKWKEGMRAEIIDNLSNQDGEIDHEARVKPIHMDSED